MPQQISVFAENKPGKIDRITEILEKNKINIRAITIADTGDYGLIKLIVDKPEEGCAALKEIGLAASLRDVVAVRVGDEPGGLRRMTSILAKNNINIDDASGFSIRESNDAIFVFHAESCKHAEKVLREAGVPLLSSNELYF